MKVAVLGSGNGACAAAFDWAYHGHEVALWGPPGHDHNLVPIEESGSIACAGDMEGTVEIAYAGTDAERATKGAELVMVVSPAFATEALVAAVKDLITPAQTLVVMPGASLGAIVAKNALGLDLESTAPIVGETSTLPYGVRVDGPAHLHMYNKLGGGMWAAALPHQGTDRLTELLRAVYPGMEPAKSILQTSLQNGNPVIHPAVTLCNASRIQSTGGDFRFYDDGVTQASGALIEAVDDERLAIAARLGIDLVRDPDLGVQQGYMAEASYHRGYVNAPGFAGIPAQKSLDNRYFTEDVGYGLVFLADLARQVGVPTPTMDAIVHLVSKIMDRDYRGEAVRTLQTVGLGGHTLEQLRTL